MRLLAACAFAAVFLSPAPSRPAPGAASSAPPALAPPGWVSGVTRMTFAGPDEVERAARAGAQVLHTNLVWPYYPLRRDGGGLAPAEAARLRALADDCRRWKLRLVLGLPPFPPVSLVRAHPEWRVHPTAAGALEPPTEDSLGTRLGCNVGPWGDYLIDVCAELLGDYGLDGFSFDGNYHPPVCHCPACRAAYRADAGRDVPQRPDLASAAYREYLVWRGQRLEQHYARMQARLKAIRPGAVLMSWSVNAGRYGHFLHSPRAMPSRLNRLFDLPMQEMWLDETNLGASVAPAFGMAYLRAAAGDRAAASECYLMSRGNPYGTHSFPVHERLTRALQAVTYGGAAAESLGWPGHRESTATVFAAVSERAPWLTGTRWLPWAALLASEQTRQFYAWGDIAGRHLPPLFGAFRACLEERLPVSIVNDWDLTPEALAPYAVLILPNAAALSGLQVAAVREYVRLGGGLVATSDTSLCDELGRPRGDFALAGVFGVGLRGRPPGSGPLPESLPEEHWRGRSGVAALAWDDHPLLADARLRELVPGRSVLFRGPHARVSDPARKEEIVVRLQPEGAPSASPGVVARQFGRGRVVYFAAGVDAALWSYAFPYQRRLLARAVEWAAARPAPVRVDAPMCVQAAHYLQESRGGRWVIHLFNGVNTAAHHGLPSMEVPLREETLPVHGIRVHIPGPPPRRVTVEPGGHVPTLRRVAGATIAEVPPLEIHAMLVVEPGRTTEGAPGPKVAVLAKVRGGARPRP